MKLIDLIKPGHVVEYRNGNRRFVVANDSGELLFLGPESIQTVESFRSDLKHFSFGCMDIVRIYTVRDWHSKGFEYSINSEENLRLVWERIEEPVRTKMTVSEIEQKLNIAPGTLDVVAG